jgi:hypothetical protein
MASGFHMEENEYGLPSDVYAYVVMAYLMITAVDSFKGLAPYQVAR